MSFNLIGVEALSLVLKGIILPLILDQYYIGSLNCNNKQNLCSI